MKVNKEDSAWPVTSPAGRSASQQQVASATPAHVHVNPRFVQPPATAVRFCPFSIANKRMCIVLSYMFLFFLLFYGLVFCGRVREAFRNSLGL